MTQSEVQQSLRSRSGSALDFNSDWEAVFDGDGVPTGAWNERCLVWINQMLSSAYGDLPGAQQAFAASQGYMNWATMGAIALSGGTWLLSSGTWSDAGVWADASTWNG